MLDDDLYTHIDMYVLIKVIKHAHKIMMLGMNELVDTSCWVWNDWISEEDKKQK